MYTVLLIIGSLLTADTVFLSSVSNGHLGTVLPAVLGVPLIVIGLFKKFFASWFHTHAGAAVKWILVSSYCLFLLFYAVTASILASSASKKAEYNKDVLIVLGCAVRGDSVSLTLKYRLDTALEYLEHSPDTAVIVSGGKGSGENISEARAMKDYLMSRGVPDMRIIVEDQSSSTWENFEFAKKILDERFPDASAAFVTTGFHVYRSARVASMHGIDAQGYAAKDIWYSAPNNYLREAIAVTIYKLRGQLI